MRYALANGSHTQRSPAGIIAGTIIGVICALAIIAAGTILCIRKRRNPRLALVKPKQLDGSSERVFGDIDAKPRPGGLRIELEGPRRALSKNGVRAKISPIIDPGNLATALPPLPTSPISPISAKLESPTQTHSHFNHNFIGRQSPLGSHPMGHYSRPSIASTPSPTASLTRLDGQKRMGSIESDEGHSEPAPAYSIVSGNMLSPISPHDGEGKGEGYEEPRSAAGNATNSYTLISPRSPLSPLRLDDGVLEETARGEGDVVGGKENVIGAAF